MNLQVIHQKKLIGLPTHSGCRRLFRLVRMVNHSYSHLLKTSTPVSTKRFLDSRVAIRLRHLSGIREKAIRHMEKNIITI